MDDEDGEDDYGGAGLFFGRSLEIGLENDLSENRPRPRRFTVFPCLAQLEPEFGYLFAEIWKLPHLNSSRGISLFPPRILRAKLQSTRLPFCSGQLTAGFQT